MKRLAVIILAFFLLSTTAGALSAEETENAVPESAREILGDASVGDGGLFDRLGSAASDVFLGEIRRALKAGCAVFCAAVLYAAVSAAFPNGKMPDYAETACALAVTAVSFGNAASFLTEAKEAIDGLCTFGNALLPCLAAAGAMSGETASSAAKYAASAFFMNVSATLAVRFILPLVGVFLALSAADAAIGDGALIGAAGLAKRLSLIAMAAVTSAFVIVISVSGAAAAASDAAAIRAAKTVISVSLPVVGGILSDAAGAVLGGASLLRGSTGIFGLAVTAAVCLEPVMKAAAFLAVYRAAGAAAGPFAGQRISSLLDNIGTAFGLLLGLVGTTAAVLFISTASAMRAVSL